MNPPTPLEPRDLKPTPTGEIIVDEMNARMPAYADIGLNLVHVGAVSASHWLAFEPGRIAERYILACENLALRDLLPGIPEITGQLAPLFRIQHLLTMLILCVNETVIRVAERYTPRVSTDSANMPNKGMFFTCEKARNALGFAPRPATEVLRDAIH